MHSNMRLLLGAAVLLAVALIGFMFGEPSRLFATGEVCAVGVCSVSDQTISDFAQGQFYLTGLRNTSDGKVQLLPFGLTTPWNPDPNALPVGRTELATVIYKDIIYVIGGFDPTSGTTAHPEIFTAQTLITGPLASAWTNPINLPVGLGSMPAVISTTQTGAYLYVMGGSTDSFLGSSGYTSTIFYHALNSTGAFSPSVGGWLTATMPISNPTPGVGLVYHQAVAHNGFLYLIGGNDGSTDYRNILHAPISANGSLGAWTLDPLLPTPRSSFAVAVFPSPSGTDYLYVLVLLRDFAVIRDGSLVCDGDERYLWFG